MEQKSTFSPAMQFGLLTGLVLIVFSLIMFLAGVNEKSPFQFISYVLLAVMLFWGITNIRDRQLDGVMSYGKAFGTGFWIALFAAILVGIFTFFYLKYINPGFISQQLQAAEMKMQDKNMSQEQIAQAMKYAKTFSTPVVSAIMALIWEVIIGTVFSLIIAIFAKREDKTIA
jgi:hypothetical protein